MIDKNRMKRRPDSFEKVRASRAARARVFRLNWRRESLPVLVFLAFAIGILGCIRVNAQIRDGTLSGKVTSPSGAPVAKLVLKNIARSDVRSVTLNSDGTYTAVNLLPGTYEITAWAQGFEDAHATVAITSDGKPVVNLVMRATSMTRAGR